MEIFWLEMVIWLGLWLSSAYIAALLTIVIGAIVLAVLIIALLSEAIERSRVPGKYFQVMAISLLTILLAAATYFLLLGGELDSLM